MASVRADTSEPNSTAAPTRPVSRRTWPRWLPPARLAWIFLLGLGGYGSFYLDGLGSSSIVVVPLVAATVDLALQGIRFERWRFPDAALVTGLFLALILPPTTPLLLGGALAFAAVALRHALRTRGRPWFNPAALGVLLGVVLFGLAPAWWVGIGPWGEALVLAFGLLLIVRSTTSWRLPATFLLAYGSLSVVQHFVLGASTNPQVLFLQAVDPATVFFALFMVTEPRTAPAAPQEKVLYAGVVGTLAAFLPIFLPSLGVIVSLLGGNGLAVALRHGAFGSSARTPSGAPGSAARRKSVVTSRRRKTNPTRWPMAYRVGAGVAVVVVLAAVAGASPLSSSPAPIVKVTSPGGTPPSGGGSVAATCQSDNPSIPASQLSTLHRALGPSVILSYDSSTGVVVFYDTVNHVTVTESDLFEDYGFAEFNGDDYAVNGCAP